MNDRESHRAEHEARRDVSAHSERPAKHEEDIGRYLTGEFYAELKARDRKGTKERGDKPEKGDKRQRDQ